MKRKRIQIRINLPDHGAILAMTPVEMILGVRENWRGVTEVERCAGEPIKNDSGLGFDGAKRPSEAVLYRIHASSKTCWVIATVCATTILSAEQFDARKDALKAFAAASRPASPPKPLSVAKRKVLDVLARNSERLLGPGYVGDEVWGPEQPTHAGSNCSAPFARVAGKMLTSLKALGYAEYVAVHRDGRAQDWGWRITPAGRAVT